jgi:hypothetical protein
LEPLDLRKFSKSTGEILVQIVKHVMSVFQPPRKHLFEKLYYLLLGSQDDDLYINDIQMIMPQKAIKIYHGMTRNVSFLYMN